MESNHSTNFNVDKDSNTIHVEKTFLAPLARVWNAWTKSELLDQWWAPKPWRAVTKEMSFREGGQWVYSMEGPEGESTWGKAVYKGIDNFNSFEMVDTFIDENGIQNNDLPTLNWMTSFKQIDANTLVTVEIKFDNAADVDKIMEMGFKEGFEAALENLVEFLEH